MGEDPIFAPVDAVLFAQVPPIVRILALLLALPAAFVALCNGLVLGDDGRIADRPAAVPPAPVALVLGARAEDDGRPTPMLADRVDAGIALWRARRVRRLLLSGNDADGFNREVQVMRERALAAGVPADRIAIDRFGVDTWDSMRRAHDLLGVRRAVVVTQGFHLPRALFLAGEAGLAATGLRADRAGYGADLVRAHVREAGARVKAVADVVRDTAPKEPQRR